MFKIYSKAAIATALAVATLLPIATFAQTTTQTGSAATGPQTTATMPVFYSSTGQPVNQGTGALPAGYYYLQPGQQGSQIYYYGNGTYYNPVTGEYGGSVGNPNGTAGANLGYYNSATGSYITPGVPNTGAGGDALTNWLTLVVAVVAMTVGVLYLGWRRKDSMA